MGLDQSTTDPSLYKRGELHVCVFVDDCLCTFPTSDKCVADYKEFVECIRKSFALRDDDDGMTDTNEFCGMLSGLNTRNWRLSRVWSPN